VTAYWRGLCGTSGFERPPATRGKTGLILGNEIQEFLAGRVRYIMEFEPSMEAITCDGC
jgi:hypothetical protein